MEQSSAEYGQVNYTLIDYWLTEKSGYITPAQSVRVGVRQHFFASLISESASKLFHSFIDLSRLIASWMRSSLVVVEILK